MSIDWEAKCDLCGTPTWKNGSRLGETKPEYAQSVEVVGVMSIEPLDGTEIFRSGLRFWCQDEGAPSKVRHLCQGCVVWLATVLESRWKEMADERAKNEDNQG